jgi:uncharacterized RDD family membrane protein YckC
MDEAIGLTPPPTAIAGIWRRFWAFCLDGLLLGVFGACLGLVAYDGLAALGDWGRALGLVVALAYYGLMDSEAFGGQTLGKRLLGIRVVTVKGTPLTVSASTLRAAIFWVPYFLNGAFIETSGPTSWLVIFLVFGVGISIVYLLLFNRRTRQSLHDLAVGAYVVSDKIGDSLGTEGRVWRVHFGVVGMILTVALFLPYLSNQVAGSLPFVELLSVQQALQRDPDVRHATVASGVDKSFGKDQSATTTHTFTSDIVLSRRVADFDPLANRLAHIILAQDPSAEKENLIAISLHYGYDIGIASGWQSRNFAFSPDGWRKRFSQLPQ